MTPSENLVHKSKTLEAFNVKQSFCTRKFNNVPLGRRSLAPSPPPKPRCLQYKTQLGLQWSNQPIEVPPTKPHTRKVRIKNANSLDGPSAADSNKEKYHLAISRSCNIIRDLTSSNALFDFHVFPWARKVNLTSEFQDAQALIHCEPHNSAGYLYASALWSIRANAKQALTVLEKGIHEVSPTDPHYALLEHHKELAEERLQLRFDIIVHSPYDIFCAVVTHLDIDSLCESLVVNHAWRDKLLECPDPWRQLAVDRKLVLGQILPSPSGSILPLVAQHNENLTLYGRFPRMNDKYLDLIETDKFPHLRSLRIHDSVQSGSDTGFMDNIYRALPHVAETLSSFAVSGTGYTTISLERVLSICPNLKAIECASYTISRWTDERFWTQTTKLTKVDLYVDEDSMTASSLVHLFRCSPDLQILKLTNCSPDTLEAIESYCPKLVVLAIAPDILYDLETVDELFDNAASKVKPGQQGLRALILSGIQSVQPLQSRLHKSRDTLEEIHIYAEHGDSREGWLPLTRCTLKSMKSLTVSINGSAIKNNIPVMLRAYPNLTTLKLDKCAEGSAEEILQAVTEMSKLSCFQLKRFTVHGPGLSQLLKKYSSMGARCPLKDLRLLNCHGSPVNVVMDTARIRSLEKLTLENTAEGGTESCINEFTRLLAGLPHLVQLTLKTVVFTDDAAQNIMASRHLRHVYIACKTGLSPKSRKLLRNQFQNVVIDDI